MGKNLAIIKPNGVKIDVTDYLEKFSVTKELMQIDLVEVSLKSDIALDIDVFDYIVVNNQKYTINVEPKTKKVSNTRFEYDINFEGAIYELKDVKFFDLDKEKESFQESFDLAGDFYFFISVVVNNLKRKFGESVQVKNFVNDIDKQITFNDDDCLSALIRICQDYNKEFFVYRENGIVTIDFISVGREFPMPLAYGFEKGLYALNKSNAGDENLCNKAYVRGGTDNIPLGYRGYKDELLMPTDITAAYKKLELEVQGYTPEEKEKNKYLVEFVNDKNNQINSEFFTDAKSLQNGLKEKFIRIEDIYPNRTGTIDFVDNSKRIVGDATMFDLNARDEKGNTKYLVAGKKAVMFVKTGNLAGYTFEIASYNTAKKEFVLMPYTAQNGDKYPSNEFLAYQFKKGDTYTLLEINLPDSYLNDAEYLLFKKAAEEFQIIKHRKREYTLNIDEFFAKELSDVYGFFVKEGDYVTVIDKQLNVNDKVRVKGFTFDVLNDTYDINLSDTIVFNTVSTATRDISKIESILKNQGIDSVNKSKSGVRAISELKANIFDTDGYFDNVNIKPLSIDTSLLSVGARSQYISTNLVFSVNYLNNANKVSYTSASLFNQTLDRVWTLVGKEETIADNEFRYVYAKANKNATDATLLFTKDKIEFDSVPTHYHFLLGTLHSVVEGKRILSLTYGSTTIQGGLIKTGRISSNDGKTVFDLDSGVITGKITFTNDSPALEQIDKKIKDATDEIVNDINEQMKGLDKSSEAYAIAQNVPRLNSEKAGLDARYNEVYNNAKLTGTAKTDLAAKKTAYNTAFTNVVSYINAIISDKEITDAEKVELNKRMVAYDTALSNLTKALEVADVAINNKNVADTKADLTTDINGVKKDLKDTEDSLNKAIEDGVLSAKEKAELNTLLQSLKGSKLTLDKRVAYALTLDADAAVKTDVTNNKIAFDTTHTNLNNTLVTLLAKDTVTEAEKTDLDNKFKAYNTALSNLEESLDKLLKNASDKAISNIEIGGENILGNSGNFTINRLWYVNQQIANSSVSVIDGNLVYNRKDSGSWNALYNSTNFRNLLKNNSEYVVSITVKSSKKGQIAIYLSNLNGTKNCFRVGVNIEEVDKLIRYSVVLKTNNQAENYNTSDFPYLQFSFDTNDVVLSIKDIKFEKGNKPSDWSQSISDINYSINNATDSLRNEVNGAIKDGIISEAEAQAIGSKLSALDTQKKAIDEQYINIYSNLYLKGTAKTDLASKKTTYNTAYSALVAKINSVVSAKVVTVSDKTILNNLFDAHDASLAAVLKALDVARQSIEDEKIKDISVGGRNFIKKAYKKISIRDNRFVSVPFTEPLSGVVTISANRKLIKGNSAYSLLIFYDNNTALSFNPIPIFRDEGDVSFTCDLSNNKATRVAIYAGTNWAGSDGIYTDIDNLRIQKGNKSTDWTPAPEDLEDEIKTATDSLRNEVNGAIKDGIISEAEAQAIGSKLSALSTQKAGVDAQYNEVYSNLYLKGTAKTDLASKKTTYNTAYSALVAKINSVVSAKVVTVSDKTILNNLFDAHDASLAAVLKALDVARQSIEDEKINSIELGGTNLLINSADIISLHAGVVKTTNYKLSRDIEIGINYIIQCNANNDNTIIIQFKNQSGNYEYVTEIDRNTPRSFKPSKKFLKGEFIRIYILGTANPSSTNAFDFKLEKGNKPSDWSPAPEDLGIDAEELENLKNTTARIDNITNFLDTTTDGNVVASGTFLVGAVDGTQKAGITGVAGSPANQVKKRRVVFWAGDTFANREIAPVRIWDDGMIEVTNAKVKGEIESSKGKISSFTIADEFMTSERQMYDNTKSIMKLGGGGLQVDYMKNNTLIGKIDTTGEMRWQELYNIMEIKSIGVSSQNVGYSSLFLESSNGHALRTKGRVLHDGDFVVSALDDGIALFAQYLSISNGSSNGVGMTKTIYYRASNSSNRKMNFINGIMVSDDIM